MLVDLKPKALVVDDDTFLCHVLAKDLQQRGYEVRCAHNGREALQLLLDDPKFEPVVILSDHDMPLMTGSDFYHQLRQTFPDLEPRFIMMSGSTRGQRFAASVSVPFLDKPFSQYDLDRVIQQVLP